jgi:hypothetical protein
MSRATTAEKVWLVGGVAAGVAALVWAWWPWTKSGAKRVALIGDSYAVGLGPQLATLMAAQNVPFKYEGHIGSTVAQWNSTPTWGSWLPSFGPSLTLISLGVNEYLNPSPSLPAYRALAARVSGAVWVMPPNVPKSPLTSVRSTIEQVGVPVVPAATIPIGSDGIHPTSYTGWAAFIFNFLQVTPGLLA